MSVKHLLYTFFGFAGVEEKEATRGLWREEGSAKRFTKCLLKNSTTNNSNNNNNDNNSNGKQTNERTNEPLVPDSRFQRWPRRTICIILLVNTRYEVALPDSHLHSLPLTPSTPAAAAQPRPYQMQTFTRFRFFDCHKIFDRSPKKMEVWARGRAAKPCPTHTVQTPLPSARCPMPLPIYKHKFMQRN